VKHLVLDWELAQDLESVTLIDQKLLPLCGKIHLLCVLRDQRIKESIVAVLRAGARLRPGNSAESLRLLPSASKVTGHLDDHICIRDVDRCVSDLSQLIVTIYSLKFSWNFYCDATASSFICE